MTSRSVRDLASGMTPLGTILAYAAAAAEAGKKAAQERSRGRRADISGEEDDIDKHVRWWEGAQPARPSSTEGRRAGTPWSISDTGAQVTRLGTPVACRTSYRSQDRLDRCWGSVDRSVLAGRLGANFEC
jgi:hypothetical protein